MKGSAAQQATAMKVNSNSKRHAFIAALEQLNPSAIRFISEKEKPDIRTMQAWIRGGQPEIIAHVRDNSHFVLVIGFDRQVDTIFYVNDPFYNTTTYNYSDMSDLILYVIKPMD